MVDKEKESVEDVIKGYRRNQQMLPFILGGLAIMLLISGLLLLAVWMTGPNKPAFMRSPTPIASATVAPSRTPRPTFPATFTPTPTETPTETPTPTQSGPLEYVIQEGDNLYTISKEYNVDVFLIMMYNDLTDQSVLFVGQTIIIPPPDAELPTPTPLPDYLPPGAQIQYMVLPGDSLQSIASQFNSTIDDILAANDGIDDPNQLYIGQILNVPVNLVTPTPTPAATAVPTATP